MTEEKRYILAGLYAVILMSLTRLAAADWYKGNLHTHTNRSYDADTEPQRVAAWYAEHGYDFLVLTDHNLVTTCGDIAGERGRRMLVIPGDEVSCASAGHLGALNVKRPFRDYEELRMTGKEQESFRERLAAKGETRTNN